MSLDLPALLAAVAERSGLNAKADIAQVTADLPDLPFGWHANGDDTAAIPNGDGYQLLAIEGFINRFVDQDPWFAGWCGVMVNLSDIAAMGGRPVAVVNALWDSQAEHANQIMAGMIAAAQTFDVPIVGGHTNLSTPQSQLAVAVLGQAKKLLSSYQARSGQVLIAAIDLRGAFRRPFLNWNCATEAPAHRLRADLELLPALAEKGWVSAAKDISQAGILGTLLMLLECSGVAATIDLQALPKPDDEDWLEWLCAFPSYGYLLSCDEVHLDRVLAQFHQRDIAAACIGQCQTGHQLTVQYGHQSQVFRDLKKTPLMGFKLPANPAAILMES
ncbi:sll0787 family AIR synthase-like protein [Saccharospirillum mangrovi]|uniref:sll0787 family AIR synthase-like protein n=1 Tax=Saccharospirillum mangrovi TaxID=2161747 RepID=UPI000D3A2E5D|nr:sll0787 family AIR synthase-like protein [Saccharospirillum mangrovi]